MFTRVVAAALVSAGLISAIPAAAQASAPPCEFVLGFKALHDALPGVVGSCLDDEAYNSIGDSVQHTSGGLLAWRRADNWTAFTDGFHTWVSGPNGIQERLNTERFPWEADQSVAHGNTSVSSSTGSTTVSQSSSGNSSTVTVSHQCSAEARSGDVSAVGLNSTTVVTGGGATVIQNHSSSSSTPGVATTGC